MGNKIKAAISMFFMSFIFYMMITTRYTHALGDYILEYIGLNSWTGDYSGMHLTVVYFGILFIISLLLVNKYSIHNLSMRKRTIFLFFILLITVFYSITSIVAINIKKNSSDLLSIAYDSRESIISYQSIDNKFHEFNAEFMLTNYSNEKRTFHLSIDCPFYRENNIEKINFYNFEGELVIFELGGNESKTFSLSLNDYNVTGGLLTKNGSKHGKIQEIVLTHDDSQVRLDGKNFIGIELSR